jgi:hypothetical protein
VRLYAATSAWLEAKGGKRPLWRQAEVDAAVNRLREEMGEPAFAAAWEAGCGMTWEEAAAYAL